MCWNVTYYNLNCCVIEYYILKLMYFKNNYLQLYYKCVIRKYI